MARYAVFRTGSEEAIDVLRWLDKMLIKLVGRFAQYKRDDTSSFKLSREFNLYPQFMYHLRRSQFLQTFNESPDEAAYYRSSMITENVTNSLVMIQPALLEYSFDAEDPVPVNLYMESMKPNVILLFDTFFHTIIWHGKTIHEWEEEGYDKNPEYQSFANLLQAPLDDAEVNKLLIPP